MTDSAVERARPSSPLSSPDSEPRLSPPRSPRKGKGDGGDPESVPDSEPDYSFGPDDNRPSRLRKKPRLSTELELAVQHPTLLATQQSSTLESTGGPQLELQSLLVPTLALAAPSSGQPSDSPRPPSPASQTADTQPGAGRHPLQFNCSPASATPPTVGPAPDAPSGPSQLERGPLTTLFTPAPLSPKPTTSPTPLLESSSACQVENQAPAGRLSHGPSSSIDYDAHFEPLVLLDLSQSQPVPALPGSQSDPPTLEDDERAFSDEDEADESVEAEADGDLTLAAEPLAMEEDDDPAEAEKRAAAEEQAVLPPPSSEGFEFEGDEMWADLDDDLAFLDAPAAAEDSCEQEAPSVAAIDGEEELDPLPPPTAAPAFVEPGEAAPVGFVNARGSKLDALSHAAIAKAEKLLEAAEGKGEDLIHLAKQVELDQGVEHKDAVPAEGAGPAASPAFVGFSTGSGRPVTGPSKEAIAASSKLFDNSSPEQPRHFDLTSPSQTFSGFAPANALDAAPPPFVGFQTGHGRVVAGPSEDALAKARKMMLQSSSPPHSPEQPAAVNLDPPRAPSAAMAGFTSGSDVAVAGPIKDAVERAERDLFSSQTPAHPGSSLFHSAAADLAQDTDTLQRRQPTPSSPAPHQAQTGSTSQAQPTLQHKSAQAGFQSPVMSRTASSAATPRAATPSAVTRPGGFRPPLGPRTAQTGTPVRPSTPLASLAAMSTPKASPGLSRLKLGMTPGQRPATLKKFATPFKGGKRPEGITASTPGASARKAVQQTTKSHVRSEIKRDMFEPVFDLALKTPRQTLAQAGFRPQTFYYEQLQAILPAEVLDMSFLSAGNFVFSTPAGGKGEHEALAEMARRGCGLPHARRAPWLANHWQLIVWKLASIVRSQPDLRGSHWSFEHALDQLLYRYEREFNRGERSAIQRIQEQDSPSTVPLVLCVSQIIWDEPEGGKEAELVIVGLELTDGWYRIRANIDETLRSAVQRGKIVEGAKLQLVGAKLEANREGTDVLEALNKSNLALAANSTSLAPWHTKLGFAQHLFVATLESLTAQGGLVPLLDVEIETVFPTGYVDMSKKGKGETWNEGEEKQRAEAWEKGREAVLARMEAEAEKDGEGGEWHEVLDLLQEQRHRLLSATRAEQPASTQEEADEVLDRIELGENKLAVIAALSPTQVDGCLALAADRVRQSREQVMVDLQVELQDKYPPRDVRAFRVLRIRDARPDRVIHDRPRTAQLNVWDPQGMGDGFFKEGKRFLVSAVRPKGAWGRKTREVSLTTGRDTRWQLLDH